MANRQIEALTKQLHPLAEQLVKQVAMDFSTTLLLQAKILAYQRKDDVVLSNHVSEALNALTKEREQSWWKQWITVVGGALFGAFIQGFITELSTGRTLLIVIYTILGFLGMLLVFLGLRR